MCHGTLSFGLARYAMSEFELLAEELLMSDSVIKVSGRISLQVHILLCHTIVVPPQAVFFGYIEVLMGCSNCTHFSTSIFRLQVSW